MIIMKKNMLGIELLINQKNSQVWVFFFQLMFLLLKYIELLLNE